MSIESLGLVGNINCLHLTAREGRAAGEARELGVAGASRVGPETGVWGPAS